MLRINKYIFQIYNLKNVKRGQIKLKFEWFYLTDNPNDLHEARFNL